MADHVHTDDEALLNLEDKSNDDLRRLLDELSVEEKQIVDRDLTVVSNRPAGSVGFTEVNFGVIK